MDYSAFNDILSTVLTGLLLGAPIAGAIYFLRKRMHLSRGQGVLTYGLIDETGVLKEFKIDKSKLNIMGKWVTIPHTKDEDYIYLPDGEHTVIRKGQVYCEYHIHDPYPRSFAKKSQTGSANEIDEIADSKVVFDLLRFTLSNIEQSYLILAIINIIVTGITAYMVYSVWSSVGTENNLLSQIVHYLFPNAGVPAIVSTLLG